MGTRADFYVGKGKDAEWLGSIAWDGYRSGIDGYILKAKTEAIYRKAVEVFLSKRDDRRFAKDGWPWPWNDSGTSDCSYWFFDGKCWDAHGVYLADGSSRDEDIFLPCNVEKSEFTDEDGYFLPEKIKDAPTVEYPDMSARKRVTDGGFIVLRAG